MLKFKARSLTVFAWVILELFSYVIFAAALSDGILYCARNKGVKAGDLVGDLSLMVITGAIIALMFLYRWKTKWPSPVMREGIAIGFLALTVSVFSVGVLVNWYLNIQIFWLIPISWFLFFGFVLWHGLDISAKIDKGEEARS